MNEILTKITELHPFNVYRATNVYLYGSRVYGTQSPTSDYDYLMVTDIEEPYVQFKRGEFNLTAFSLDEWQKRLEEHEISALECLYLPADTVFKNDREWPVEIQQHTLRRAVSAKASNSFVKAKKKMTVENDIYTAKKSLFHALRIPMFGKQLAEFGRITDYSAANKYWHLIRDCAINDWSYYKKKYQPVYNNLMSEFRKAATK